MIMQIGDRTELSVIIPAFNEAKRLPLFLDEVIAYCANSKKICEVIVVDDGSNDETFKIAMCYKGKFQNLSILKLERNRGKGYAVKEGILKAKGDICVYIDADGSVSPKEIEKNAHYILKEGYDIFVGSRVLKSKNQILKVRRHRKFIGMAFNFFVQTFLFKHIRDTQCGFKMFKKEVAQSLFGKCYLTRFGFDMEILYLANKMGYRIKEGPVSWSHVSGSKVNLFIDPVAMFFNIFQIKIWHSKLTDDKKPD